MEKDKIAEKIVNHFMHKGATISKSDYNFVLAEIDGDSLVCDCEDCLHKWTYNKFKVTKKCCVCFKELPTN